MTARYLALRLAQMLPTVAGILLVVFLLIHLAPGDPILAIAGEHGDGPYYAFMRERFGLDRPLVEQLLIFGRRVLGGDFGMSYVQGRPAMEVILERVPATLLLMTSALVLSSVAGVVVGAWTARRPGTAGDLATGITMLTLSAAPAFWLAQLAILVFALQLGLFPVQGMTTAGSTAAGLPRLADIAWHLTLPMLVLAAQELAAIARLTRESLIDELASDYARTARAKGLAEPAVLIRHALRRALLPVVTVVGSRIGQLLGGTLIVEIVFAWPGLGRLTYSSLGARDAPVLLGIFFLGALAVVAANLITDLVYGRLDARVRYR